MNRQGHRQEAKKRLKAEGKSKKWPQHYWFYDELYLFDFRLVWPVTIQTLSLYIKDEFGNDWTCDKTFGGKALKVDHAKRDHRTYVIALTRWKGTADCHATLSHECNHIASMILDDRGVAFGPENDEAFTYLQAYLLRKCLNVLMPNAKQVEVVNWAKPRNWDVDSRKPSR